MSKKSIIIVVLAYFFSSCYPSDKHENLAGEYLVIKGKQHFIVDETARNFEGRYIFGNEDFPQVYDNFFKKNEKNLYICIGSLRCFVSAAFGNFSSIIFVDKDPAVTEFNRRFRQIISALDFEQFTEWLNQDVLENKNIKLELEKYMAHDQNFGHFFWKNSESYSRLKIALHEKKIAMASGNIAGGPSINSIIKIIETKEWKNVYLDISNISPNFVPAKDIFGTLNSINSHGILYLLFKIPKIKQGFTEYGRHIPGQYFYFYADKFNDIKIQFLNLL